MLFRSMCILFQFFDLVHHCFSFPDYQLVPTLEEFSLLLGVPVLNQISAAESVNMGTDIDKKEVKIGANLELSVKQRLIQMPRDYVEIFSWSYEDMLGLDTDIVVHRLPTKEDCPPVK